MGGLVSVLFCCPKGPYPKRGLDCWTEDRDARGYTGPNSVVAHPPCGRWCGMARLNERRWGAKVGDDGGCFASALFSVLTWGGVLEHPAGSLAWAAFGLAKPPARGWLKAPGYWVCEVWQSAYGHLARKRTWLLYVGNSEPFDLDWSHPSGTHQIGGGIHTGNNKLPRLTKEQAIHSPDKFADTLIALARRA